MKTSPHRRKHRRRAFRRLFWLLVLATLLLLLWPRRVTLDGLNSPHAILLRADSGEVLAEKDADSTIYPASMTKMMTALLAIEANPDLDTPVTLPEEIFPALQAQNASLAGFQAGETATVRDLLYGAMLPSGAECCEALAREVSGSEEAFVARMNQRAKELGCTSTSFTCVHGLYDYGNVSSAHDLALIAKACAENETYMQVANTLSYTLPATNLHQNERTITSTNLMLNPEYPYYRDYIRGMKTGFTTLAGRCYVTFAQKDGHTYGLVVLGSDLDNIYREASEILDWAFASFSDRELVDTETPLTTAPLKKCRSYEEVELYAAAPVSGYGHADDKVTFTYDLQENISATVKDGAVLGTATVYLDGYEVGTVDLVTHQEYVSDFRTDLQSTFLLMAALIVLLAVLSFFTLVAGGGSLNLGRRRKARRR